MRILIPVFLFFSLRVFCQDTTTLPSVIIQVFEKEQQLLKIAAPVSVTTSATLSKTDNMTLIAAVNSLPGVRLEERSPGSYRVNIRGSSLRSPFGVRNVKVYINDLPFTEPGGHTYFNQLGFPNVASLEIIRGPASSFYGAGTGGVMLIKTLAGQKEGFFSSYSAGSFATNNIYARIISKSKNTINLSGYQHQQSNGYRNHSESKRQVFNFTSHSNFNKGSLLTTILYGNLFYETPGGLTLQNFLENPRFSRPGTSLFPSAESARASVKQQMIYGGTSFQYNFSSSLKNRTGIYGMYTTLRNPNIQGYDASNEPHYGLRSVFGFRKKYLEIESGIEYQDGNPEVNSYENVAGTPGNIRLVDMIKNKRMMLFIQASYEIKSWILTASGSYNSLKIGSTRTNGSESSYTKSNFTDYAPRLSLLKYFRKFSLYAGFSGGFSPPTTQEILPSGGDRNPFLEAESGTNAELGTRGNINRLTWDLNVFTYRLKNTIVQRRTAGGSDYYINAGSTKQAGVELQAGYNLQNAFLGKGSQVRLNYTYYNFRYREFERLGENFSGNKMPSVPEHLVNVSLQFVRGSIYAILHYEYIGKIPLNDANEVFSDAASVAGIRIGWEPKVKLKPSFFIAAANIFDELYSLGNDFNAFGGRYYNAAPGRNYSAGVSFNIPWQ